MARDAGSAGHGYVTPVRIAIAGCAGRTGAAVLRLASVDPSFTIVAALTRGDDPNLGQDAGSAAGMRPLGLPLMAEASSEADALIEFTTPEGCVQWAEWCAARGVALISGTTGLFAAQHAALDAAAKRTAVLWAPNMSIGVNLLLALVQQAAEKLDAHWDAEIVEVHHRHKVDAPSGTAKALLEAICRGRGTQSGEAAGNANQAARHGREGACGPRPSGEIGMHALRMGEIVGAHEVHFASGQESLVLAHQAMSRDTFAAGALQAARWLMGHPPGRYGMRDVLGL